MSRRYDLVVIGSGSAASSVATRVRQAGRSVALIDRRPLGGTCALRGCDPKRVLGSIAETVTAARRLAGRGIRGEPSVDWPALMAFKTTFTAAVPAQRARSLADAGIDVLEGTARFTAQRRLAVGGTELEAGQIVLAAGAEPVPLGIPGSQHAVTHEEFLTLPTLPPRIAFIGGGYIAAEFSNIAAAAGARVTVLQRGERMLAGFDPDLVGWLMDAFRALGITVETGASVQAIERRATVGGAPAFTVQFQRAGSAGADSVEADLVVHAAGRRPALAALDLAAGAVAVDDRGRLRLNEWLQSASNPAVYAAGDAAQRGPPLTPVAARDGEIVATNLLEGNTRKVDDRAVPTVAFTLPPIAAVGLSEAAARAAAPGVRVKCARGRDWYTARRLAEPVYGFKLLLDESGRRLLGAHLVGPAAEDTINLFALAIRAGLPPEALRGALFAYPTAASDIGSML